jgi:hypothetical protein
VAVIKYAPTHTDQILMMGNTKRRGKTTSRTELPAVSKITKNVYRKSAKIVSVKSRNSEVESASS